MITVKQLLEMTSELSDDAPFPFGDQAQSGKPEAKENQEVTLLGSASSMKEIRELLKDQDPETEIDF